MTHNFRSDLGKVIIFWISIVVFDNYFSIYVMEVLHIKTSYLTLEIYFKLFEMLFAVVLNIILIHEKVRWKINLGRNSYVVFFIMFVILFVFSSNHTNNIKSAFVIGIIASIPEEYIFRNIITGKLMVSAIPVKNIKSVLLRIAIASSLFSLYHLGNAGSDGISSTLLQMIQVIGLGFFLGCLFVRKGSVLFPIAMHFFIDYLATIINGIGTPVATHLTFSNLLTSFFIMCVYIILGITILDVNNPGNWELLKKSNSRKPKLYSAKKQNN